MSTPEKVVTLLQSLLSHRERQRAAARPARVLGRHEDGTERLQRLDATCVTRSARDNHYTGTILLNPATSTIHRTGTTGIPTITETAAAPWSCPGFVDTLSFGITGVPDAEVSPSLPT